MKKIILLALTVFISLSAHSQKKKDRLNILMIAIDDMNNWPGAWEGKAITPNIDGLAHKGTQFKNAHCVVPACNPSRVALLTGQRPETTGQYTNPGNFRNRKGGEERITLPQFLMDKGYETIEAGKVFHKQAGMGKTPEPQSDPVSWTFQHKTPTGTPGHDLYLDENKHAKWLKGEDKFNGSPFGNYLRKFGVWGAIPQSKEECGDWISSGYCADYLQKKHDKPFLLACGIFRPHSPQLAPQEYFDMYPLSEIEVPEVPVNDMDDIPNFAKKNFASGFSQKVQSDTLQWKKAVQAYKACITFADDCVGQVLESLKNSQYANNTIVILWSDHGWQLGHKDRWEKFSLWNIATNAPMIIKLPEQTKGGKVLEHVSYLDIYPTLVELLGYEKPEYLEGNSLTPLLENPMANWEHPAVVTYVQGCNSILKDNWNYIVYKTSDEELYNLKTDPNEFTNLANNPKYKNIIKKLRKHIPKVKQPQSKKEPLGM